MQMICSIISDGTEVRPANKNEFEEPYASIKKSLLDTIWKACLTGYTDFYVNCEHGIPLWAAETICALKLYSDIRLYIVVPFEEQCREWSEDTRGRYYTVHQKADGVFFADLHFSADCYFKADRMMIDKSDAVLLFGKSGIPETEKYADEKNVAVYRLTASKP